ncbi:hypothetical protein V6Z11_A01G179500 [Gossypium hirsutum]
MFSLKNIPSTSSILSTYTTFTASAMLIRSVATEVQAIINQLIPEQLRNLLLLKVSKAPRDKKVIVNIHKGQKVVDMYEGIQVKWEMTCVETKDDEQGKFEIRVLELSFHDKFMETVINSYLPYVMERSKAIKKENKAVELFSLGNFSTFDKLAMDPAVKKELVDDLDRFVRRRDYYKRVGKAWKRGYLLYGPPGTGKSSLIAAIANYLKFDIYDLELTSVSSNSQLRGLLVSTRNRSMLVIEDIDCSIELQNRQAGPGGCGQGTNDELTLSGLLNFIDGLWSSCGDERIIVPALLRPGRMDMHIHMSYCIPSAFRVLASNYLCITDHDLFNEIDKLMLAVEVTPAQVAEELMKSEDTDIALQGLINFLRYRKLEADLEEQNESKARERVCAIDKIGKINKTPIRKRKYGNKRKN